MSANRDIAMVFSSTITDAQFRAYGALISAVFTAGGFDLVADSGDIDWGTVAFPGVNSTTAGYEIRTFDDGEDPFFVKLEYGRDAGTAQIRIGITIGTGSDGAGTITGQKFTQQFFKTIYAANTYHVQASATASYFNIASWASPAGVPGSNSGSLIHIERTTDASRVLTDRGGHLLYNNPQASTGSVSRLVRLSGSQPLSESGSTSVWDCCPPTNASVTGGAQESPSSDISVWPVKTKGIGTTELSVLGVRGGYYSNYPGAIDYVINVKGVNQTMTMMPSGTTLAIAKGGTPANTTFGPLVRYE